MVCTFSVMANSWIVTLVMTCHFHWSAVLMPLPTWNHTDCYAFGQGIKATVWVFETNQVCHVWCNFSPGYSCRTTVIFEMLKAGTLQIYSLALNKDFSHRNVFQNGVNSLSKMVIKNLFVCLFVWFFFFFRQKTPNFVQFGPYDFVQISLGCGTNFFEECTERL